MQFSVNKQIKLCRKNISFFFGPKQLNLAAHRQNFTLQMSSPNPIQNLQKNCNIKFRFNQRSGSRVGPTCPLSLCGSRSPIPKSKQISTVGIKIIIYERSRFDLGPPFAQICVVHNSFACAL
jgi:hypothetical protein